MFTDLGRILVRVYKENFISGSGQVMRTRIRNAAYNDDDQQQIALSRESF